MELKRSIWLASTKSIGSYRKFKLHHIPKDVKLELARYSTFDGIPRAVLEDRILKTIKQSLRVRGINWLAKMRTSFLKYESKLTQQIRALEGEVIRTKNILKDHWPSLEDPNTSVESVIRYYKLREDYLKAKIKLESFVEHRKNIKKRLETDADGILLEK